MNKIGLLPDRSVALPDTPLVVLAPLRRGPNDPALTSSSSLPLVLVAPSVHFNESASSFRTLDPPP